MNSKSISATEAAKMVAAGVRLIDIRGEEEHARERIEGVCHAPLQTLEPIAGEGPVIFHCRSGRRTAANADRLGAACSGQTFLLEGGIDAWKAAGLPVIAATAQPIDPMRQVQIIGGALIILSVALGWGVAAPFLILGAAVGLGMLHAGLTGSCAMARLLAPLPWNRRAAR